MHSGYLFIETHPDHPGLIRLGDSRDEPAYPQGEMGARVRYIAKYNDLRVAHMHVHEVLRHHLVDCDRGLYRVGLGTAMAAIEVGELRHVRKWIDPAIGKSECEHMRAEVAQLKAHRHRVERTWQWVGYVALGWLCLRLLGII